MARRTGAETRDRIRAAASTLFQERGYARTSVRDIAAVSDADPAVVIRQFGSKELLFLETMHPSFDEDPLLKVPLDELGTRFIEVILDGTKDFHAVYLALVHGSNEPSIAARLRAVHEETFVAPLASRMSGEDAELRARLAASLVGGLLYSIWVVGDERLLAADHASIVSRYGALLQALLTPAA